MAVEREESESQMTDIEIIFRTPSSAECNRIQAAVGWREAPTAVLETAFRNSLVVVCATADGKVIGMGRVVGDLTTWNYIQHVIVLPDWQKLGVGRRIMRALLGWLAEHAPPTSNCALVCRRHNVAFYERFGLREFVAEVPGMRMKLREAVTT